ncbi:hypothetical protein [Halorubrum sp. SS7]|uniref:hypothetical protein n=1 Tax=Halorubrum sp. SS7 TaxID=2518119 RepID=UPI00130541BB|nr:hypothetical protein [Halorubrum sp. SS7]
MQTHVVPVGFDYDRMIAPLLAPDDGASLPVPLLGIESVRTPARHRDIDKSSYL